MDFSIPRKTLEETERFKDFLGRNLAPSLSLWYEQGDVPRSFLALMAKEGWFNFSFEDDRVLDHQAKAMESADFFARLEAARLMMLKACWAMDKGMDFRLESSLAKYLAVAVAREVTL